MTVVATGFDADRRKDNPLIGRIAATQPATVSTYEVVAPAAQPQPQQEEIKETVTFPSKKIFEPKMIIEEKIQPKPIQQLQQPNKQIEEDDELEIPAFIRRKMEK